MSFTYMKKGGFFCILCFLCFLLVGLSINWDYQFSLNHFDQFGFILPMIEKSALPHVSYRKWENSPQGKNLINGTNSTGKQFVMLWYAIQPYFSGNVDLTEIKCTYSNCKLSDDKSLLNKSDVVLFAYRDMYNNVPRKKDGQIWVIVNIESPVFDSDLSSVWNNKFDWSMTYRQDSEVLLSYKTFKRTVPLQKDYHSIFRNKTGFAAWTVSNCHSKSRREDYVRKLKKYIDVDVYGRCGNFSCSGSMSECHELLSQKYKFYLGFENSICKDYVTEKVFHTFLDNSNAIYISRGAPNVASILPPKTFINALDFKTPRLLAEHLIELGANEDKYVSILKEIDKYHIDNERNYNRSICDLCELMNTYKAKSISWTGRNFNSWYRRNVCNSSISI